MATKHEVLKALCGHIGRGRGLRAKDLACRLQISTRELRKLISELRDKGGIAICGRPSTGYYIAETADDVEETCRFLRGRAMHSLRLEARLRRITLPELVGQLKLTETQQ